LTGFTSNPTYTDIREWYSTYAKSYIKLYQETRPNAYTEWGAYVKIQLFLQ